MKKFIGMLLLIAVIGTGWYVYENEIKDGTTNVVTDFDGFLVKSTETVKLIADDAMFFVNEGGIESTVYDVKKKVRKIKKELSGK